MIYVIQPVLAVMESQLTVMSAIRLLGTLGIVILVIILVQRALFLIITIPTAQVAPPIALIVPVIPPSVRHANYQEIMSPIS